MSEQFFTKAQRDFVRNNLRVGSGYIIVKNDDGSTAYTPIYIERESGQVYNPLTGKPLEILLGGNDAEQSFAPDSLKAVVNSLPKSLKTGKPLLAKSG